jgi:hypothetical protein
MAGVLWRGTGVLVAMAGARLCGDTLSRDEADTGSLLAMAGVRRRPQLIETNFVINNRARNQEKKA